MKPQTLHMHGSYGALLSDTREALEAIRDNVDDKMTLVILEDKFKAYNGLRGFIGHLDDRIYKLR